MGDNEFRPRARWVRSPNDVAYRAVRDNITQWAGEFTRMDEIIVPACPEWTVRDLIAHLVEISWKVAKRTGMVVSSAPTEHAAPTELVQLWQTVGAMVDHVLVDRPDQHSQILIMDALTHELDIRQALGIPAPFDHPAMRGTLDLLTMGFGRSVVKRRLPALLIEAPGGQWTAGKGPVTATVVADRYDLFRSLAGRRTHEQISQLSWSKPATPWLPAFEWGPFHPPAEPAEYPMLRGEAA